MSRIIIVLLENLIFSFFSELDFKTILIADFVIIWAATKIAKMNLFLLKNLGCFYFLP